MLLVSWNVAGRTTRLGELAELLLARQELTASTLPIWSERPAAAGYLTVQHAAADDARGRSRPLFVLSACCRPARLVAVADVPWPELVLALQMLDGPELVNVHSPISQSRNLRRFAPIRPSIGTSHSPGRARGSCAATSTPLAGSTATGASGRLPDRGEEWERAALLLVRGLEHHLVIAGLAAQECRYEHRWREGRLSDHSRLIARLSATL